MGLLSFLEIPSSLKFFHRSSMSKYIQGNICWGTLKILSLIRYNSMKTLDCRHPSSRNRIKVGGLGLREEKKPSLGFFLVDFSFSFWCSKRIR